MSEPVLSPRNSARPDEPTPAPPRRWPANDLDAVRRLHDGFNDIKQQLARVIVGQDQVIEELLIALFSRGHCILEGVPGLAKTLDDLARCPSACRWPSAASSSRPT